MEWRKGEINYVELVYQIILENKASHEIQEKFNRIAGFASRKEEKWQSKQERQVENNCEGRLGSLYLLQNIINKCKDNLYKKVYIELF